MEAMSSPLMHERQVSELFSTPPTPNESIESNTQYSFGLRKYNSQSSCAFSDSLDICSAGDLI